MAVVTGYSGVVIGFIIGFALAFFLLSSFTRKKWKEILKEFVHTLRNRVEKKDFSPLPTVKQADLDELTVVVNDTFRMMESQKEELYHRTLLSYLESFLYSSIPFSEALNKICQALQKELNFFAVYLHLREKEENRFRLVAHWNLPAPQAEALQELGEDPCLEAMCLQTGEPVFVQNYIQDTRRKAPAHEDLIQFGSVPLKGIEKPIGALSFFVSSGYIFSLPTVSFLSRVGNELGPPIEARAIISELESALQYLSRKSTRLLQVYDILHALSTDPKELAKQVVERTRDLFSTRYSALQIFNNKGQLEEFLTSGIDETILPSLTQRPRNRGILGALKVCTTPLRLENISSQPGFTGFPPHHPVMNHFLGSCLRYNDTVLGLLYVADREDGKPFSVEDEEIMSLFASGVASAIFQARLYQNAILSEQRYLDLYEHAPDMYHSLDDRGIILSCNITEAGKLGYRKEHLIGQPIEKFLTPASRIAHRDALQKILNFQKIEGVELQMVKSNGESMDVIMSASLISGTPDHPRMIRAILRDITERKALEEQLFHSQKMESLGTLAGGVAHDFNNILAGILGFASLVKSKLTPGSEIYSHVELIESTARKGADLTQQLLAFARSRKAEVKIFNLHTVLDQVKAILTRTFPKNISIVMHLDASHPHIEGDEAQIQQSLLNICLNARDAMPDGGTLTVETRFIPIDRLRSTLRLKERDYLRISISDTGVGIPEEMRDRIFEPFFSTKPSGTGLGLAVAYGVVKNHGGTIEVRSEQGKGSTFLIYLPIAERPAEVKVPPPVEIPGGSETVLVADDEAVLRNLLKEILQSKGYRVLAAKNGKEAVDIFLLNRDSIDLMVVDLVMPEMSGEEVVDVVRHIRPEMKILVITGYSQESEEQQSLRARVQGFLQKPFDHEDLLLKVRGILDLAPAAEISK